MARRREDVPARAAWQWRDEVSLCGNGIANRRVTRPIRPVTSASEERGGNCLERRGGR